MHLLSIGRKGEIIPDDMSCGELVFIFKKQTDIQELVQCVKYFSPRKVNLYFNHLNKRCDIDTVKQYLSEMNIDVTMNSFDVDLNDHLTIRRILHREMNCSVICLNIQSQRHFYTTVPWLYRRKTIVHVSDGFVDTYGIFDTYRAIRGRARWASLRAALLFPIFWLARASVCFNPFHPLPIAFAHRSLPIEGFPITKARADFLRALIARYAPRYFIFGGYDLDPHDLAQGAGLTSYLATTKERKLICNGEEIPTDGYICAEEIISLMRPRAIVGTISTALVMGRLRYPGISVFCIESPGPGEVYGPYFTSLFRRNAEPLGILFPDGRDVTERLLTTRRLLATELEGSVTNQ